MRWRRRVDPRVAAVLSGAPREQALAWGTLADGGVAVCTDLALHAPGRRVTWDLVVRASWSEEFLDLMVQDAPGARQEHVRLRFDDPGEVPAVVRERVEWSIVASQRVTISNEDGRTGGALISARRSPESGEVRWAAVLDAGIDPRDPGWRLAVDRAIAQLREQLGV